METMEHKDGGEYDLLNPFSWVFGKVLLSTLLLVLLLTPGALLADKRFVASDSRSEYQDCVGAEFEASYLDWLGDGYCDDGTWDLDLPARNGAATVAIAAILATIIIVGVVTMMMFPALARSIAGRLPMGCVGAMRLVSIGGIAAQTTRQNAK